MTKQKAKELSEFPTQIISCTEGVHMNGKSTELCLHKYLPNRQQVIDGSFKKVQTELIKDGNVFDHLTNHHDESNISFTVRSLERCLLYTRRLPHAMKMLSSLAQPCPSLKLTQIPPFIISV